MLHKTHKMPWDAGVPPNLHTHVRALILFIQTLQLYKSFTYLLTYLLTYIC